MNHEQENHTTTSENHIQTLQKAIAQPVLLETLSSSRVKNYAVPNGYHIETDANLEQHQPYPNRMKGDVLFVDMQSFIDYVNLYKTPETRLYAEVNTENTSSVPLQMRAVFNEHEPKSLKEYPNAGWRDFGAYFVPKASYEWKIWTKNNRDPMGQFNFAVFIEDNIKDIHQSNNKVGMPSGTDMLNLAVNFELTQDKHIKSIVRTQSGGTRLDFIDTEDAATQERMEAFNEFAIGIPVFFHGKGYEIFAKLRYRQKSQQLNIWYELVRPDLIIDAAVTNLLTEIEQGVGIKPMYVDSI